MLFNAANCEPCSCRLAAPAPGENRLIQEQAERPAMATLRSGPNWKSAEQIVRILVVVANEAIKIFEVFRR
jgi:hypothetical protein